MSKKMHANLLKENNNSNNNNFPNKPQELLSITFRKSSFGAANYSSKKKIANKN